MYELSLDKWPYKGTDTALLKKGFNCFYYYWSKKVAMALWKYDIWWSLWNEDQITYVQTWARATNNMHVYPFTSLDELTTYLLNEEGYSPSKLVTLVYDSVNQIDPTDEFWVWGYDCSLRSYSRWIDFRWDFFEVNEWDTFISWVTNPYGDNSVQALKTALKTTELGVHLDYIEMLGDYFGPDLEKLTGDKHDWFIRRIRQVYHVGNEDAESILLGRK